MGVEPKLELILSDVQVLSYFPLPQPIPNSPVSSQTREGLLSAPSNLYAPVTEIGSTQSGQFQQIGDDRVSAHDGYLAYGFSVTFL